MRSIDFRPVPLEVRHLRLVVAIVDEGGLTRAGERLNLTQSALSHQLKQVEETLGVALFARTKKRLVLTPAGEELVTRARRILADVADLESDLRGYAAGRRGKLRLATQCYTAYEWLPPLLKKFRRMHPNIDVEIVADATADPLTALRNAEIDLALISKGGDSRERTFDLFSDEMLLLVAPSHPLANRAYVTAKDFVGEHIVAYSPPSDNFFYQEFIEPAIVPPPPMSVIKLTEAMLAMVRAGLGIAAVSCWTVADEVRSGRVAGVRIGRDGFFRNWRAAVRASQGDRLPAYLTDFIALIAESAAPARFSEKRQANA